MKKTTIEDVLNGKEFYVTKPKYKHPLKYSVKYTACEYCIYDEYDIHSGFIGYYDDEKFDVRFVRFNKVFKTTIQLKNLQLIENE